MAKPRNYNHKEWSREYLLQQYSAMRWLAKAGLSPAEIREMRWGMVDEGERTITIKQEIFYIKYDIKCNMMQKKSDYKELKLSVKESGHENFFLRTKYKCPWMFTCHVPHTWKREESREALFPVEEIEHYCRDLELKDGKSVLTLAQMFDTIETSKVNITKMDNREQEIDEAEVVSP